MCKNKFQNVFEWIRTHDLSVSQRDFGGSDALDLPFHSLWLYDCSQKFLAISLVKICDGKPLRNGIMLPGGAAIHEIP